MAEMVALSKELTRATCQGYSPAVQWAAVRTCWGEMRVPPHQGWRPFLLTRATCQGYWLGSVSCPPTILMLFVWPQEQVPGARVGGAAVTGVSVVFWEVLVTSI